MSERSAVVVYAHPYPDRSRAGRALLDAVRDLPRLSVRTLYALYPDFAIDVDAEQAALRNADVIVWQSPIMWYGPPALLHLWFEKVLTDGWAYGAGGTAIAGKRVLWTTTTGGAASAYAPGQIHGRPFSAYVAPIEQTALFCGMQWEPPLVVHGAHRLSPAALAEHAASYRARLSALLDELEGREHA
jgi:glutathione-regulated potassium-efflux system ancillary protein KefF